MPPTAIEGSKTTRVDTSLVVLAGMILVINSHLEAYYPRAWMAGDGLLGNSLFFLVSGFGVTSSLIARPQGFADYFLRRVLRIYPALLLTELAFGWFAFKRWSLSEPGSLPGYFLYPTRFTYVRCIVMFYPLVYVFVRFIPRKAGIAIWIALVSAYVALCIRDSHLMVPGVSSLSAVPVQIYNVYFFMVTLAGSHLARAGVPRLTRGNAAALAAVILLYAGVRVVVSIKQRVDLFPLLQLASFATVVQMFRVLAAPEVVDFVRRQPAVAAGIAAMAALSLETYLLHTYFAEWPVFARLPFPLGVIAIFAVTFTAAIPLAALVRRLRPARASSS